MPVLNAKNPTLVVAVVVLAMIALTACLLGGMVLYRLLGAVRYRALAKQCPSCRGFDVRPSWPSGFVDALLEMCACAPYRCRACRFRYYRFRQAAD